MQINQNITLDDIINMIQDYPTIVKILSHEIVMQPKLLKYVINNPTARHIMDEDKESAWDYLKSLREYINTGITTVDKSKIIEENMQILYDYYDIDNNEHMRTKFIIKIMDVNCGEILKDHIIGMIKQGLNLCFKTYEIISLIFEQGNLDIVKTFLQYHPESLFIKIKNSYAFFFAMQYNTINVIEYLTTLDDFLPSGVNFYGLLLSRCMMSSNIFRKILNHHTFNITKKDLSLVKTLFHRSSILTIEDYEMFVDKCDIIVDNSVDTLIMIIDNCSKYIIYYLMNTIYFDSMNVSDHIKLLTYLSNYSPRGPLSYNFTLKIMIKLIKHETFVVCEDSITAIKIINKKIKSILIEKANCDQDLIRKIDLIPIHE